MKKLLVMAVMILSSVGAFAQYYRGITTVQPRVGMNVSTVDYGNWKVGVAAGVEFQHQLSKSFALSEGIMYSTQGNKNKHKRWNPGYINVPVTISCYVAQGLALKAGVQPGVMVVKDGAKGEQIFDFSIPVGFSYEYENIVFDARYNIGTTYVFKHTDHGCNNVIQVTVGYKFRI